MGKYVDYQGDKPYFINPYNFVPVNFKEENSSRKDVKDLKGTLSGVISCTLTTKTPLCLPDVSKSEISDRLILRSPSTQ